MWLAKDRSVCQLCSFLSFRHSLCVHIGFCFSCESKSMYWFIFLFTSSTFTYSSLSRIKILPCKTFLSHAVYKYMQGFWLGIIAAFMVQVLFFLVITIRSDWEKEVRNSFLLFLASNFFFSLNQYL